MPSALDLGPVAATETPQTDEAKDPARPIPSRAWWHRRLLPEERRRVMSDLAITRIEHWVYRFYAMLTLSVVVAVMGLWLDSAAVVIGAMLLAPLMQPVLAAGACLSMALFNKSLSALLKVALATVWCIGIAFVISAILGETDFTGEIDARTQPDIKDLVVALAAGAAGAYATVRADASSSLPGVAVAVALVPPVATVGIAAQVGDWEKAQGALLLYITNLAAIIFASIVVFVITGFVPPRRLSENVIRLTTAALGLTAVVAVIAVPLYRASVESRSNNEEQTAANVIVDAWLGPLNDNWDKAVDIKRDDLQIEVEVSGFDAPPDEGELIANLQSRFPGYGVSVEWIQTLQATTTTLAPPEPTELLLEQISLAVNQWLDESGVTYQIDDITLNGTVVRIDAAVIGELPDVAPLIPMLAAIDPALSPVFNWSTLETFTETTQPSQEELTLEELRTITEAWAESRGLIVQALTYDGERVEIDITGSREPVIDLLEEDLRAVAGEDLAVSVYFTERLLVTSTTTTTTTLVIDAPPAP